MKLKTKLAEEFIQISHPGAYLPEVEILRFMEGAETGYLAGFEKARIMCRDYWKKAREDDSDIEPEDLMIVGEEEVE